MEHGVTRHPNRQLLRRLDRAKRFQDDRYRLRLTHLTAAKLLDVSVRTVQNWESGRTRIPHSAFKLVRLLASGKHLDGPAWKDFQIRADVLITPKAVNSRRRTSVGGHWSSGKPKPSARSRASSARPSSNRPPKARMPALALAPSPRSSWVLPCRS